MLFKLVSDGVYSFVFLDLLFMSLVADAAKQFPATHLRTVRSNQILKVNREETM